jgi:hypothetical protein
MFAWVVDAFGEEGSGWYVGADGLERETIFVYDILLAPDFTPACQDGEAVKHRRIPLDDAAAMIANGAGPDVVTANASLTLLGGYDMTTKAAQVDIFNVSHLKRQRTDGQMRCGKTSNISRPMTSSPSPTRQRRHAASVTRAVRACLSPTKNRIT